MEPGEDTGVSPSEPQDRHKPSDQLKSRRTGRRCIAPDSLHLPGRHPREFCQLGDGQRREPLLEQLDRGFAIAEFGRGLFVEKVSHDVTDRLRLDQRAVGAVQRLAMLGSKGEHVDQAPPNLVARFRIDLRRQVLVDPADHLLGCLPDPIKAFAVECVVLNGGLERRLQPVQVVVSLVESSAFALI